MKLGTENRRNTILAAVLGAVALLAVAYQFIPSSSTIASTGTVRGHWRRRPARSRIRAASRHGSGVGKKEHAPQSLDPTLHLQQLAATEQIKYEGSGRNIFVSQAEGGNSTRRWLRARQILRKILRGAARTGCATSDSLEVFWLCESAGRTEESFSFQGRGRFHCRRR